MDFQAPQAATLRSPEPRRPGSIHSTDPLTPVTTSPDRYRVRPDRGLDLLDETGMPIGLLSVEQSLAILYRCESHDAEAQSIELHGPAEEVIATWRKMWPALTIGTLAGGPEVNGRLRLASYPVAELGPRQIAMINAVLSHKAKPDTLERALRETLSDPTADADHDPAGSPPAR